MPRSAKRLSELSDLQGTAKLDRTLLRDTAVDKLREFIGSGLIPEGTKISEREVSEMLGISRMPARDALMILEHEGLVENRSDGRYVIELTETKMRCFLQVRAVLERLAAELAAGKLTTESRAALLERLMAFEEAAAQGDGDLCARRDIELHETIWQIADNALLQRFLQSTVGIILVLNERVNVFGGRDLMKLVADHRALVEVILSGDTSAAGKALEEEMRTTAMAEALPAFRAPDRGRVAGLASD